MMKFKTVFIIGLIFNSLVAIAKGDLSIASVNPIRMEVGAPIVVTPSTLNNTGQTLFYTCKYNNSSMLPSGAIFSSSTGVFTYFTRPESVGQHILMITATAGSEVATLTVPITIEPWLPASGNSILFEDDFSDQDLTKAQSINELTWQTISGTISSGQSNNIPCMFLHYDGSRVITNQTINVQDFTISFECNVIYSTLAGIILLYQDENNYYKMNLTKTVLTLVRIMNGKETTLGQAPSIDLTIPHGNNIWGGTRVHILRRSNSILFEIGRAGTGIPYSFSIEDKDSLAIQRFSTGRFGFYNASTGAPANKWVNIQNVLISSGKVENYPLDPKIFYVSSNGSNANNGLSSVAPFQTIQQAVSLAMAGDTISVNPGIYRESIVFKNNGTSNRPITMIAADPTNRPVIDGSTVIQNWQQDANIFTASFNTPIDIPGLSVFQNNTRLPLAMEPDATDPDDIYNSNRWYTVTTASVPLAGSSEESKMLADGVEYLILDDHLKTVNGKQVGDNYWKGALLFQYDRETYITNVREILSYDALKNQITVKLISSSRITAPNDKYAIANHIGVLDKEGEYILTNDVIKIKHLSATLGKIQIPALENGISIPKSNIIIDGFEIRQFKKYGITNINVSSINRTIKNCFVHHNGLDGFYSRYSSNCSLENCELSYNGDNGINFASGSTAISILDCNIHHNTNNGIWLGGGIDTLYACEDILIKNTKIMFQGSAKSHPDNIQIHQVNNLTIDNCVLQQNGSQNMWCQFNGNITINNCRFIDGPLGLNCIRNLMFTNNLVRNSYLRFDAYNSANTASAITTPILIRVQDIFSWDKIQNDIQSDITQYPHNLLWNTNLAFIKTIRSWASDQKIADTTMKEAIVARINDVINDLDFYKSNTYLYDKLNSKGPAREILDAMIEANLINKNGTLGSMYNNTYEIEIKGLNRVILDELCFEGKIYKSVQNYRSHKNKIQNNAIIESSIQIPPKELFPYFIINANYYNIVNNWYYTCWSTFKGFGERSILTRVAEDTRAQFINPEEHNYQLKTGSSLIDAGIDVGLPYQGKAPDIGYIEYISSSSEATTPPTQGFLREGLVSHCLLDDGSGPTATDANNIQLTANIVNGPLWGAGWRDEDWLGLNQSTQAITIPTMGMSPQTGTIAVWLEPKDFSGMKFIFGHVLNNANRLSLYTVAGSLAVGLGSNATLKTNITPLSLNQPVHLALSWEGTAYAVYVNGVQKAAGTFSGLTALNTFIDIGNYGDPAFRSLGFAGKIDDIRTYNRALAAEEIDALYLTHDVRQGKELQFTVNAVNAQGIPIVYQASAMPAGASFDAATQSVRWTPWHNQLGLFSFRFTSTGQPEKVVNVEVHPSSMTSWYTLGQGQLTKVR